MSSAFSLHEFSLRRLICSLRLCTGALVASAALASHAQAQMALDNAASDLRFISVKGAFQLAEVHRFKTLSGLLTDDGKASLVVDLSSVETGVPIRNERMQNLLFDVTNFSTARFDGQVDMAAVKKMVTGDSMDVNVKGQFALHGKAQEVTTRLRVNRLASGALAVSTLAPIVVDARQYDLTSGIDKLREIMGLPLLVYTVPVNFAVVYK